MTEMTDRERVFLQTKIGDELGYEVHDRSYNMTDDELETLSEKIGRAS